MEGLNDIVVTGIVDVMTVFSPKGRFERITDRICYGMSFCREGQITYTHNGKSFVSDNRHVIILPQGQSYTLRGDETGIFPVVNFTCGRPLGDTFLLFPVKNVDVFVSDFELMKKLILFPESRARVMSVFYNMIYGLVREESVCETLAPAVEYIKNNYKDSKITNGVLARECRISEVYLRKLFDRHFQTTPQQYVADIRLQRAKQLLSEGILKIGCVAEECGFSSSYNFCRFFKSKTGSTPTEYMRRNRVMKI